MAFGLDLGNLLVHLRADESQFIRALDNAEKKLRMMSDKLTSMGRKMTMRVTAPIVAMGAMATKSFASFDDAMTKSLAIMSDVTPAIREEMELLAVDISKKSVTSATQLAKSYFYLASAGLSAQQSISALAAVERFAVAGAFDMALATDLITDAQSALGMTVKNAQKNLENLTRVSDVLTGANTLANASTQQFSEGLMRAGPAMKAYGIELEEGVAVLAAYADQGKKAAEGGEMFGRMLRLMIKGFIDEREAWDKFKISIVDTNDKMRPLADIMRDITNLLSGMGVTQKATTLMMLGFQARSQQTVLPLLGLGDAIELYNEKLLLMRDITKDIYEKQLKSFSSQMKIVWNNVVSVGREIGQILAPAILVLNRYVLKATDLWASLNDSVKRNILLYAGVAAAIGPVLLATGLLVKSLAFMVGTLRMLRTGFALLAAAISAPLVAVLALAAVAYVLRTAWIQNLGVIKDRLEDTLNAFEEGFNWLLSGPVGSTVKTFAKAWIDMFYFIGTNFGDLMSDMAGTLAGTKTWLQKVKDGVLGIWDAPSLKMAIEEWKDAWRGAGEGFASSFVKSKEKAEKAFDDFSESVVLGYKTTVLTLSAFGEATVEHLEKLMKAVKTQFGEDADAIISLIKTKIEALQTPIDELRETSEAAFGEKMLMDEVVRAIENIRVATEGVTEEMSEGAEMIERMLAELDTEYDLLGKINEERERAVRLEKFLNIVKKEHIGDLEKILELTAQYEEKLNKIAEGLRGWSAFTVQIKQWHSDATNLLKNLGEVGVAAFDNMADALTNMVISGKADFKSLALSVVADLTRMMIKYQMAQALGIIFPSLAAPLLGTSITTTSTFTPAVARAGATIAKYEHGGLVMKPQLAMVGEVPELITPLSKVGELFGKQKFDIHIHNESSEKLEISEVESYMISDQRIIDVTVIAAGTNAEYRRSVKQASR